MSTKVISHKVHAAIQSAVIVLESERGVRRTIQVRLAAPKSPCQTCGRGFPLTDVGETDIQALIAAECASMDADDAAVAAYAAKHLVEIIKENS